MDLPDFDPALLTPRQRAALAGLFASTTNSYKFLLFLALVERCREDAPDQALTLSLRELLGGMLAIAWFPYEVCRLRFGPSDRIGLVLDRVAHDRWVPGDRPGVSAARAACREWALSLAADDRELRSDVLRYVVERLLRPFFEADTRGVPDHRVGKLIARLSREQFEVVRPLYRVNEDGTSVTVHPSWARALAMEAPVFHGWATYRWLQYMQRCNPNTPALARKLMPTPERESLQKARQHWALVAGSGAVRCPYSSVLLDADAGFALDHFIPWSFVVHDEFWNLVPASPAANLSKGQSLPSRQYVEQVASTHFGALTLLSRRLGRHEFERLSESYILGLNIDQTALTGASPEARSSFIAAYERTVIPLLDLASAHGFDGPWVYS